MRRSGSKTLDGFKGLDAHLQEVIDPAIIQAAYYEIVWPLFGMIAQNKLPAI